MASSNKAQFLTEVQTLLKKRYKPGPEPEKLSVLEAIIFGICHERVTRDTAVATMATFKSGFFDWNEVRVCTIEELQRVFHLYPDSEARANRLRRFLRQLFEKTYSFTLDALMKKPQKEAIKALDEYDALHSDFVMATVIRLSLGGHAIPVDIPIRRALTRLGVDEGSTDDPTFRSALERAIPKTRAGEFMDLIEALAYDTCVEPEPDCPRCELKKICPTGLERIANPTLAAKPTSKLKPPKSKAVVTPTALPPPAASPSASPPAPLTAKTVKTSKKPVAPLTTPDPKPSKGKSGQTK